jgi:cytochrome c-type protein NapB
MAATLAESTEESTAPIQSVPGYQEIDSSLYGANRNWSSDFSKLKQNLPKLTDPVIRTPEMKDQALRDRLRTRAFDGAPPSIPHAVEQQSAASCLVCHGNGMVLANRIATKISHPHFASCTQCHVEQAGAIPIAKPQLSKPGKKPSESKVKEIPRENTFLGIQRSGPGERLMPGAPPTIPHTLHLRNDCMSCHGLVARPGIRTTHPWLQNCVQCHAAKSDAPQAPELVRVNSTEIRISGISKP